MTTDTWGRGPLREPDLRNTNTLQGQPMDNKKIADSFEEIADLLEFQGANPFRVRAYRKGSRTIRDLAQSVTTILEDDRRKLTDVDGIGKDLAAKCAELVETGQLEMLTELHREIPSTVLQLLRIPGLGPKKAAVLFRELNVQTLDQLQPNPEKIYETTNLPSHIKEMNSTKS